MEKQQIFSILKQSICEIIDYDENTITMQDSLKNLGANSVDRADILMQTMESLEVNVSMMEFADAENIGDIVKVFEEA